MAKNGWFWQFQVYNIFTGEKKTYNSKEATSTFREAICNFIKQLINIIKEFDDNKE